MQEPLLGRWLWVGGGEGEMERGVGRERGQEGRVRDKEMDGETDRD